MKRQAIEKAPEITRKAIKQRSSKLKVIKSTPYKHPETFKALLVFFHQATIKQIIRR